MILIFTLLSTGSGKEKTDERDTQESLQVNPIHIVEYISILTCSTQEYYTLRL